MGGLYDRDCRHADEMVSEAHPTTNTNHIEASTALPNGHAHHTNGDIHSESHPSSLHHNVVEETDEQSGTLAPVNKVLSGHANSSDLDEENREVRRDVPEAKKRGRKRRAPKDV